jgi:TfoX/Sxy family transcriptional regulator of competence genes
MASTKRVSAPADRVKLYRRLLEAVPGVAERSNFGSAYAAVNGNMYSMISKHGVVGIRLPDDDRAAFMKSYGADLFRGDPAWPPANEYVAVPDDLLERTDELAPYLERSLAYALALKPKATKKARA